MCHERCSVINMPWSVHSCNVSDIINGSRRNDQVMTEQQCYSLPGGYPSPDKARLYQSMTQVPLPTSEGQKIECVLGYSLWPGCTFWNPKPRAANESGGNSGHEPRPYSDIVSELFDCPLREACDDLGLNRL